MSSSKSVRFDDATKGPNNNHQNSNKRQRSDGEDASSKRQTKKFRTNEDELDDIDDYEPDGDDDDNKEVPSERELLEMKRRRRQGFVKEVVGEDSTHIDETTSLATEGVEIEPFHMRQEESDGTGYFDGDTYVFRKNPGGDEEPDAWLDGLTDENGKQSSDLAAASKEDDSDDDDDKQKPMDVWTKEDLYSKMLPLMSGSETVAQAVRRYGNLVKQKKGKSKTANSETTSQETQDKAKACLNDLTGAANALLLKGEVDIYDTTRTRILAMAKVNQPPPQPTESFPPAQWEYMGNQDGAIHGPYTTEQMIGWTKAGYFVGDQKVKIRTIRQEALSTKDDLLADLMDDDDEEPPISKKRTVSGEWVWSTDVRFESYLPKK